MLTRAILEISHEGVYFILHVKKKKKIAVRGTKRLHKMVCIMRIVMYDINGD